MLSGVPRIWTVDHWIWNRRGRNYWGGHLGLWPTWCRGRSLLVLKLLVWGGHLGLWPTWCRGMSLLVLKLLVCVCWWSSTMPVAVWEVVFFVHVVVWEIVVCVMVVEVMLGGVVICVWMVEVVVVGWCMSFFAEVPPENFDKSKGHWHRINQTVEWFYGTVWCQSFCDIERVLSPGGVKMLHQGQGGPKFAAGFGLSLWVGSFLKSCVIWETQDLLVCSAAVKISGQGNAGRMNSLSCVILMAKVSLRWPAACCSMRSRWWNIWIRRNISLMYELVVFCCWAMVSGFGIKSECVY